MNAFRRVVVTTKRYVLRDSGKSLHGQVGTVMSSRLDSINFLADDPAYRNTMANGEWMLHRDWVSELVSTYTYAVEWGQQ